MNQILAMKTKSEAGIYPAGDRVLVKPDEIEEEITPSGIVLPPEAKRRYDAGQASGVLVAVGPDAFRHVVERVYHVHGNNERELIEERNGKTYILMNDEDITARLSDAVEFTDLDTRKMAGKINE
jgi:co-chaperonin GroES (HSP10)